MPPPVIRVEGLDELRRALKAYGSDADKELAEELKNASVMSSIVNDARKRLRESTGKGTARPSRSTGRAAASLRVLSNSKGVVIVGGKTSTPYYGWLDFGGTLKPTGGRTNAQSRPFLKRGRAIYPAIDAHYSRIVAAADDAMGDARRKAGL